MKTVSHEYFVSLEVAKLLKKVGFNWKCKNLYDFQDNYNGITFTPSLKNWNVSNKLDYSAPTLDVAQRWLREMKNADVFAYRNESKEKFESIVSFDKEWSTTGMCINTYEEALETGIKKALEMILEKRE